MSDKSSSEIVAVTAACFEGLLNRVTQLKQIRPTWLMSPKLSTPEQRASTTCRWVSSLKCPM